MNGTLDTSIRDGQNSLGVSDDRLASQAGGAWGQLLRGCIGGGVLTGLHFVVGAFWLGSHRQPR